MSRSGEILIDPEYMTSGEIGKKTATHDVYFRNGTEPTLRILVDHMLQQLEPNQRTAVQMCVMERLSYAAAAQTISVERGIKTDPKTVWRWARNGVQALGEMFERSGWAGMIEPKLLFEGEDDE